MKFWILPDGDEPPHHVHDDYGVTDCAINQECNRITCLSCSATLRLDRKSAPLILLTAIVRAGRTARDIALSTMPSEAMLKLFVSAENPKVLCELVDAAGSHDELSPKAFALAA